MRVSHFIFFVLTASGLLFFTQINIFGQRSQQQTNSNNQIDFVISEIKFEGLDSEVEFDDERRYRFYKSNALRILREERIKVASGNMFDRNEIDKAITALKEWYASHGFLDADIRIKAQQSSDKSVALTFSVNKGSETFVSEIEFTGNKFFTNEELVKIFKQDADWQTFNKNYYQYRLFKNTLDFVRSKGFLAAKIEDIETHRNGNSLKISIPISEGTRYRYGKIEIAGANAFASDEILNLFGAQTGEIADGKKIREFFFGELKKHYAAKGFVEYSADLEPAYLPPASTSEDGTANLKITIDEGLRFKLGQIVFLNVDERTAKMLRQKINLNDNEFYNQEEFEKGIEDINKLNLFRELDKDKDVNFRTERYEVENTISERPTLKKKGETRSRNSQIDKFAVLNIAVNIIEK